MNDNDVSIIIRVNDSEAEKFAKVAARAKLVGDAAGAVSGDLARMDAAQRAAAQSASRLSAEQERAAKKLEQAHTRAIIEDRARERANTAAMEAEVRKREAAEIAAQEKLDRVHAAAIAEDIVRERAKTVAQVAEVRKREAAEIAAQEKLDRLHTMAIIEDRARERARTAMVTREAEKQAAARAAAVRNFGTGTLSFAGVGFGANALGAGIALAGTTYFASSTAIEFERAEQAISAVTGSLTEARQAMADNEEQARRLGVNITTLLPLYARFEAASKGTNLEGEKARDIFYAVAEAAQRMNLQTEDTEGVLRAVEQMMSKGKIQAEELRGQLGDRLPGAFQIMARAAGVSTAELDDMLKRGEVIADEMLPKFAAELRETFGTDATSRIETTSASFERLRNEIRQTAADAGQRLNPRLADISEWLANIVAFNRENPGAIPVALFGRGAQGIEQLNAAVERFAEMRKHADVTRREIEQIVFNAGALAERAMKPAVASDFYGPGTPYRPDPIDLTAGVTPADDKRMTALQRELALMNKKTEYAKTLWLYTEGELKNANHVERALALQVAQQRDAAAAAQVATRATSSRADAIDRIAERDMRQALAREEADRAQIRAAMTRNAILEEELRTGESITRGRRELLELETERALIGEKTLEQELQRADVLERAVRSRNADMAASTEHATDEMSVYAERAAQNMQDAFANFLFDPFDRGIRGMLEDFTRILQRMAAEAAAAQIFEGLAGAGTGAGGAVAGFIGGLFGGGGDAGAAPGAKSGRIADADIALAAERAIAAKNSPGALAHLERGEPISNTIPANALADLARGGPVSVDAAVNVQAVLQVNITNNSGNRLEVEHASIEQTIGGSIINMVVRDINEGGATSRAIQRNFGLRNAPSVNY